jgi:hypothetical protein
MPAARHAAAPGTPDVLGAGSVLLCLAPPLRIHRTIDISLVGGTSTRAGRLAGQTKFYNSVLVAVIVGSSWKKRYSSPRASALR